jgi:hypothetical protein
LEAYEFLQHLIQHLRSPKAHEIILDVLKRAGGSRKSCERKLIYYDYRVNVDVPRFVHVEIEFSDATSHRRLIDSLEVGYLRLTAEKLEWLAYDADGVDLPRVIGRIGVGRGKRMAISIKRELNAGADQGDRVVFQLGGYLPPLGDCHSNSIDV